MNRTVLKKRGEFHLAFTMYTLCLCKLRPIKTVKTLVLMRLFRPLSYYTTFLHSSDNASCFHISFSFSMLHRTKAPLCKGGWQNLGFLTGGLYLVVDTRQSLRHGCKLMYTCHWQVFSFTFASLCRATSLYTREALRPTIIL